MLNFCLNVDTDLCAAPDLNVRTVNVDKSVEFHCMLQQQHFLWNIILLIDLCCFVGNHTDTYLIKNLIKVYIMKINLMRTNPNGMPQQKVHSQKFLPGVGHPSFIIYQFDYLPHASIEAISIDRVVRGGGGGGVG